MTDPHDLDGQRAAYEPAFRFFAENERALDWYAGRVVELVRRAGARSVLSLGIGQKIVAARLAEEVRAGRLERYAIVEGSRSAIAEAKRELRLPPGVEMHEAWFERFETADRFDLVEMGFVLEHVDSPETILDRFAGLLAPRGAVAIAVPNARSLHRLVGQEAGLLDDVHRLSAEDHALGHQRYFDLAALRRLVEECGLRAVREEGIFLKPLTTAQMLRLELPDAVMLGLFRTAVELPAISNAIYMEAVRD